MKHSKELKAMKARQQNCLILTITPIVIEGENCSDAV